MNKQLATIKNETNKRVSSVNLIRVRSNADLVMAKNTLIELTQIGKNIKAQKEKVSKPLQLALKANRAFFNPLVERVTEAKDILKEKMLDYSDKIDAKKEEKETEVTKKVEDGELSIAQASKKLAKIEERASAVPVRVLRKVEVIDEKKVPREYLMLDMVKIRKDALAGVKISGVKVVEQKTIVAK